MRGGAIYIKNNVGYRAGIHMKAYKEKLPVIVVGGRAGSFLGEYQAGGLIIVLGLGFESQIPVGEFCGTGMHGGKIYLRSKSLPDDLPPQVVSKKAEGPDLEYIVPFIKTFSEKFDVDMKEIMSQTFYLLTPNTKNPYHQLYTYS
jgi:glutamate synthase domain-containing protein 3